MMLLSVVSHHLDQMPAGVGRVVGLGDADVTDRARREGAGVAVLGRRLLVVAAVGDHFPTLAVIGDLDGKTVVAVVGKPSVLSPLNQTRPSNIVVVAAAKLISWNRTS